MPNIDKILALIRKNPQGLDDDEISKQARIEPRQQVQQLCSKLAASGLIERRSFEQDGKRKKIHNFPSPGPISRGHSAGKSWERRLATLEAATSLNRDEILDRALADFALTILRDELAGEAESPEE